MNRFLLLVAYPLIIYYLVVPSLFGLFGLAVKVPFEDVEVPKVLDTAGKTVENAEKPSTHPKNDTSTVTLFMDNIHQSYPGYNTKPISSLIKGVGEEYKTIIIDCLPIIEKFPPDNYHNIYFQVPQVAANLNRKKPSQDPSLQIWLHPHLHIPFLGLGLKYQNYIATKPIDVALYIAKKANAIYTGTVPGVLITSTPLVVDSYRMEIPSFKNQLQENNLKFGLIIEGYNVCDKITEQVKGLKELFSNFDYFYFHQPSVVPEEEKTGNKLEDAILEGKAFQVFFKTCEEILRKYIPVGRRLSPVRGYFRAKFTENDEQNRLSFKFDVVRF